MLTERVSQDREGRDLVARPKTAAGVRTVTLPSWAVALLATWREAARSRQGLVFPTGDGSPISYTGLGRIWTRVRTGAAIDTRSAIPDLGGHVLQLRQLRHVGISAMVRKGWPITEIARVVGHADHGQLILRRYAAAASVQSTTRVDEDALFPA